MYHVHRNMSREISIHNVGPDALLAELKHLIDYLQELGMQETELMFGWHWGMDYPPGAPWVNRLMPVDRLESEIRIPEEAGLGKLGGDDITIRIPSLDCEFLFCHHAGIHLTVADAGALTDHFIDRWSSAGFAPTERRPFREGFTGDA